MWCHPVAEAAALLALAPELVAVGLGQLGAVVEHVIAGVRGGGGHTLAKATALGAVVFDVILVTRLLREVSAVGEHIIAGGLAILSPVAHHSHGVVGGVRGAASEHAAPVIHEGAISIDTGHHGTMSGHQGLESLLVPAVGVVVVRHSSPLVICGKVGAGVGGVGVLVRVDTLMHQTLPRLLAPLDVSMRRRSITPICPVLAISTVHKLLLAVVTKLASHLLEAGLHQGHVGEGHTGATLFLILHWTDWPEVHRAIGGGDWAAPAIPHTVEISLGPRVNSLGLQRFQKSSGVSSL